MRHNTPLTSHETEWYCIIELENFMWCKWCVVPYRILIKSHHKETTIITLNHDNMHYMHNKQHKNVINHSVINSTYCAVPSCAVPSHKNIKNMIRLEFLYIEFSGFNLQLQPRETYSDNLLFVFISYENFKERQISSKFQSCIKLYINTKFIFD